MLFVPAALGIDKTDMRSAWLASLLRRVLLRLTIVDVSGFRCEPATEGAISVRVSASSDMALKSEPGAGAFCVLVPNDSTEAMVERRLPVEGKARCTARGRGRIAKLSISKADETTDDDTTDDDGAVEAISDSVLVTDKSSIDVVSRRGEEMERLLVGECWLRFAPRRLRVRVGVKEISVDTSLEKFVDTSVETSVEMSVEILVETSVLFSVTVISVDSSDM